MPNLTKRKTSLSLDTATLNDARSLGLNVSAITEVALKDAVAKAKEEKWLAENKEAFEAQAKWHETKEHPLGGIMVGPGTETWKS